MYLTFVIILLVLAGSDLIVGVSNDAVNFLNSAIGSKVSTRKVIMLVASIGILLGALFSSGMMEVARKGIFHPEMFSFAEVMVIFMAVMLTDIILLDLFNTLGMPTSTTVSIVFELLGAAVAVAILHTMSLGEPLSAVVDYINSSKALLIIVGIFLSIIIAFSVGAIAQFITRFIFGFEYEQRLRKFGAIWGGLSISVLSYFLVIKGLKGASFVTADFLIWINSNTMLLILISFVLWTGLFQLLISFTKINMLKVIVLVGTMSLAMAFASNDLVNFIGVPIAGLESFLSWQGQGIIAETFKMSSLGGKVLTPSSWLAIAGGIMILTLWYSKKAKTVTQTEINLSRQMEGQEKFKPHLLSRLIVKGVSSITNWLQPFLPKSLQSRLAERFAHSRVKNAADPASFDLIRASVNLTIAGMLIAIATNLKLPLSTTYVSFMVAMGTSLADRAWHNGSAEHRVAGVLNVIGGWFLTAIIAFVLAGGFAVVIYYFKLHGVIALLILAGLLLFKFYRRHQRLQTPIGPTSLNGTFTNAMPN